MNNKQEKSKRILKSWVKIFLLVLFVLLITISIFFMNIGKNYDTNKVIYNYNTDTDIKYKVYLKDNNFYEEKYLEENKQYPAELIDYIDIDYSFLLNGSKKANYVYNYDVEATIIGEYENTSSGKSELWKKKYNLLNDVSDKQNNSTLFNVNQNIKIKYSDYSKVVNEFKSKFRLAIDAYLNVKLKINYKGDLGQKTKLDDQSELEVNIPLTSSTITVSKICLKDPNCPKKENKELKTNYSNQKNKTFIYIGYSLLIITLLLIIISLPSLLKNNKTYNKKVNKILKSFSEIIIEVESLPDFESLELIDVKTFDDMVDIEEEIKSPIIYYEVEKGIESWFIITSDKYVYRYTLSK